MFTLFTPTFLGSVYGISYVHLHINTSQLSLWDYAEWQFSLPRLAQTPLKSQNLPTLFRGLPEILPTWDLTSAAVWLRRPPKGSVFSCRASFITTIMNTCERTFGSPALSCWPSWLWMCNNKVPRELSGLGDHWRTTWRQVVASISPTWQPSAHTLLLCPPNDPQDFWSWSCEKSFSHFHFCRLEAQRAAAGEGCVARPMWELH